MARHDSGALVAARPVLNRSASNAGRAMHGVLCSWATMLWWRHILSFFRKLKDKYLENISYVFKPVAILSHASLICGRDERKSEGHNLYLLLPIWNLLMIYLQSSIIKNPHFSSKYIYDFLIWQPVYLFFSCLAPWTFATIKGIYVILLATWHRY